MSLQLLRVGDYSSEIASLTAYHERLLGEPQRLFSSDEARSLVGDYRLAHCLITTLSHWYNWRHPEWGETLQGMSAHAALAAFPSPTQLRLELYNHVNEHFHGFLTTQNREAALQSFAQRYELTVSNLDYLLVLDTDNEARLQRDAAEPPSPDEVATLYNQWAFEAALCSASNVHFTIDCAAFVRLSTPNPEIASSKLTTGIGTTIKRLCYLARKMGVYYDLAYEQVIGNPLPLLSLTLYGPQEVTGVAQQYGLRLARLCRALLGYTVSGKQSRKQAPQLLNAVLEATATIHMQQRSYSFIMNADLLRLLPSESKDAPSTTASDQQQSLLFDSGVEQAFAEAFAALERSRAVDEWQLEREPEPLLLDQSIFIPDFALTRGQRRIYVEILGFWTPAYRERKVQKLQQLRDRDDILLAIPMVAKESYASILADFPVVFYDEELSATHVLHTLRTTYDDFPQRLANIDVQAVRTRVRQAGMLPEHTCLDVLHCYRRSELQQAALCVVEQDICFTSGVGLYTSAWMSALEDAFLHKIRDIPGPLSLSHALDLLKELDVTLQACDDTLLEALLHKWPEIQVERHSIFDAIIRLTTQHDEEEPVVIPQQTDRRENRREKRRGPGVGTRPRQVKEVEETTQERLWE